MTPESPSHSSFPSTRRTFGQTWRDCWRQRVFRTQAYLTVPLLALTLYVFPRFLNAVERRPGVTLDDPLLALFTPIDVNWLAFGLIYGALLVGLLALSGYPEWLILALQAYVGMVLIRMAMMFLTPLDPPVLCITLRDPFVQYFGTGQVLTKDLFFSGHTATMFLLYLLAPTRRLRTLFLVCTFAVGFAVFIQQAHYAVDVLAAPFFAYGAFRLVLLLREKAVGLPMPERPRF